MTLEIVVCSRDMNDKYPEQLVTPCKDYKCDGVQVFPDVGPFTDDYERRTLVSECTECGNRENVSTEPKYMTLRIRITR